MKDNRMTAYRKSQAEDGMKRLDIHVDQETHQALKDIRSETKESYGDIISRCLLDGSGQAPQTVKPGCRQVVVEIPERNYTNMEKDGLDPKEYLEGLVKDKFAYDPVDPTDPRNF